MTRFPPLQATDDFLNRILECEPLAHREVPLDDSLGLTIAEAVCAPEDLPGFRRAMVDGFAVRARDVGGASEIAPVFLRYSGECRMGAAPRIRVSAGRTCRVWTGGMLPRGADAVVRLEDGCPAELGRIMVFRSVKPGDNIQEKNREWSKGRELVQSGCVLRPKEIGLLAACGQKTVKVRGQPKAALISTGDEVVGLNGIPGPGQVRDVNSHTLAAIIKVAGGQALPLGIVGDNAAALRAMLEQAVSLADLVIVSGGSSAGRHDLTLRCFSELPGCEILAHGIAVTPHKPLIVARMGQKTLWGLPGHVSGAVLCAEIFIRPLLQKLLGQPEQPEKKGVLVELACALFSEPGRRDYIHVALEPPRKRDGPMVARPIRGRPGPLAILARAEGVVVCPEDREGFSAGQIVPAQLFL